MTPLADSPTNDCGSHHRNNYGKHVEANAYFTASSRTLFYKYLFLLTITLLISACTAPADVVPGTLPEATATALPEPGVPAVAFEEIAPLERAVAAPPVELTIPALELTLPVTPMGWTVVATDDGLTTEWQVPDDALGWHANSAGAGAQGNLLISGHQARGQALLAPLALGDITVGQELLLTDADGRTFVYGITDISAPIPLTGATAAEEAQLAAYIADDPATDVDGAARLTLITGWPDFTTTHRLIAQAKLLGEAVAE